MLRLYPVCANFPIFWCQTTIAEHVANWMEFDRALESRARDEYDSDVANSVEEAKKLFEAGFEYVCSHNETMLFRKRK